MGADRSSSSWWEKNDAFLAVAQEVEFQAIALLALDGSVLGWRVGGKPGDPNALGKHVSQFYPVEEADAALRILELTKVQGRCEETRWFRQTSGEGIYAHVTTTKVMNEHGEHVGYARLVRDLTSTKNVDSDLLELQATATRRLSDEVTYQSEVREVSSERLGIIRWRIDESLTPPALRLAEVSGAASELVSVDFETRMGKTMAEVFPESDPVKFEKYMTVARTQVAIDVGDIKLEFRKKPSRIVHIRALPIARDEIVMLVEDVTDHRRLTSELLHARRFLDSIVENIPDMIFVKDAEHLRFERFNRAGEQLLGVSRDVLIGKSDYDFFPKAQADQFIEADRRTLQAGAVLDIAEEPINTAHGQRWLHTKKIPIVNSDGIATHLLGISQDITAKREAELALRTAHDELERRVEIRTKELVLAHETLRRTEEQFRQAQKMDAVGTLAGGMAHDFNNMLSVILSYTQLLLDDLPKDSPMRSDLAEIKLAAERSSSLTKQLLAFSRQQVMEARSVDLNTVVLEMEKMLSRVLGEDIELTNHLDSNLAPIQADPGQMEQILLNLAVNARDAMPTGGKLAISTANVDIDEAYAASHLGVTPGPNVMISVTDTGVGMTKEVSERIFEPFFTTKDPGKGTGLGLSTVFGIVKQSGGSIWVHSAPSQGSTFKLFFPRNTDPGAPTLPAEIAQRAAGSETLLLVEDDELVRRAASASLRRVGYIVLEASSGEAALETCRTHAFPIHLLITDVVMPTMNGRELAQRVADVRPGLPVLFVSGYANATTHKHGVIEGNASFLQKPFTPEGLAQKVREVIDSGRDGITV
ncbi:MAG: PAS domain-containing protein [Polyangiaceae bacterium]